MEDPIDSAGRYFPKKLEPMESPAHAGAGISWWTVALARTGVGEKYKEHDFNELKLDVALSIQLGALSIDWKYMYSIIQDLIAAEHLMYFIVK